MSLITRYLLREQVKLFFLCLGAVMLAYLAIDFFEKVRRFTEYGVGLSVVLSYFLLRVPRILFDIAPLAALLGTLLALGGISRNQEFTAFRSLGIGPVQILTPLVGFGLAASLILLLLNLKVIPEGLKKSQAIRSSQIERRPEQADFVRGRVWTKLGPTTFSNIELIDTAKNTLYGINIYRLTPDFALPEVIEAKEMRYENGNWFLYSGLRRRFSADGSEEVTKFDRLFFSLDKEPKDFQGIQVDEDATGYRDLSRYVARLEREGYVAPRYAVALHEKIAYPFTILVTVLLGVPFALKDRRSGGIAQGIGISLGIAFLFWLTYSTVISIGYGGILPPIVAAWLTQLLFLAIGAYLLMTMRW